MKLNDAARDLIGQGADATLVTLNRDGSPQVSLVWVQLRSTPDGDELVTAHLAEHKKVRNVRNDPRRPDDCRGGRRGPADASLPCGLRHRPDRRGWCAEVLKELAQTLSNPDVFPPAGAPSGFLTRIRIDRIGGIGPWVS